MFVMGMAAGLIRLRCNEETISSPIPSCPSAFPDFSWIGWKARVDVCSLLLLSVPVLAQVFPPIPFLPTLNLLANVLFVLPQLIVITGVMISKHYIPTRKHQDVFIMLTITMTKILT